MIREIVDYQKLNEHILKLLVHKFPEGYDDKHIISFRNKKNEIIEAIEVRVDDTIYLVKVGVKLVKVMRNHQKNSDLDDETTTAEIDSLNENVLE
jgi:hypothetical protein